MTNTSELENLRRRKLDDYEQIVKIISMISIPVLLAFGGWFLEDALSKRSVNHKYVTLAVSILKESNADVSLKIWAVDILNKHSPIPISSETKAKLKSGKILLPTEASFSALVSLGFLAENTIALLNKALLQNTTQNQRRKLKRSIVRLNVKDTDNNARLAKLISGKHRVAVTKAELQLLRALEREIEDMDYRVSSVDKILDLTSQVLDFTTKLADRPLE